MIASREAAVLDVLLVEDDGAHAELVRRAFEAHPLPTRLFHVSDGEEALEFLFRRGSYEDPTRSPRPRVVPLDLRLPKADGLEVLARIRASQDLPHMPVVALSTSGAETDKAMAHTSPANSDLVKPADFSAFEKLMADLGQYRLGWNQSAYSSD